MKRLQAFKYELMPSGEQQCDMRRFAGACRFVFNKALAMQKERYDAGLKYASHFDMCKWLPEWKDVLVAVARGPNGEVFIGSVLMYLQKVTRLGKAGLKMALQQAMGNDEAEEIIFAYQRSLDQARLEGERAGQRALLLRQLGGRFGVLPSSVVARIEAATMSELEDMALRVLGASTLEQVVGKKKRR